MEYSELAKLFPSLYVEVESKTKDVYEITQRPELFRKFDLRSEVQSEEIPFIRRSSPRDKIHKILHFIWLGEKPLPEEFRQNILYFSSRIQKLGGVTVLWTDQVNIEPTLRPWLDKTDIFLIGVDAFFGNPKKMTTFYHFRAALAKIPQNFGEASDLLRYEIMYQFGGYYLDCDVKKEDINFDAIVLKGKNPEHGFVCGRCSKEGFLRNDLFGVVTRSALIKDLRNLVLNNYRKKSWKDDLKYSRYFLTEVTVSITGPSAFNRAFSGFFRKPSEVAKVVSLPSIVGASAESWVYGHTDIKPVKFANNQDRLDGIKHDLMLNLMCHENNLDLEKYHAQLKEGEQEWLVSLIEGFIQDCPNILEAVDRIFVGDVSTYCHLQEILEKKLGRQILWNELATLKFACVMKKNELIKFLIDDRKVSPFQSTFADVGYYDCSNAQPFAILLETGNLEIIEKVVTSFKSDDLQRSFIPQRFNLVYVGIPQSMDSYLSISDIPKIKIQQLEMKMKQTSENSTDRETVCSLIERFRAIQKLIDQALNAV